ncbi:hypothetical protein M5689_020101 [Euphorbia peplus]|nr:hypothetical protein M5689_020101 [Euphorbia peplus]
MKGLEAIDFSRNKLSCEIPPSMSTLTFLSTLDLSYNSVSARIPLSTQLQSFDSSSFIGNQLCRPPLSINCTSDNPQLDTDEKYENEDEVNVWFYVSIAFHIRILGA